MSHLRREWAQVEDTQNWHKDLDKEQLAVLHMRRVQQRSLQRMICCRLRLLAVSSAHNGG
jgi:hypothetical protein